MVEAGTPEVHPRKSLRERVPDDLAYLAPMAAFLIFTWLGAQWRKELPWTYPASYVVKVVLTAALLVWLWPKYTKIRWNGWWLGIIVGVIGIFQWVGMQLWLQKHLEFFRPGEDVFDPLKMYPTAGAFWSFAAVRMIGAVLVVPVMEELFWRDFLWRQILAPNDFKLAAVGEWGLAPFLIVCGAFATVHGNWWLTAIVWGAMVGGLLVYTKSLGACIVAHATTNLLLALYVLRTHDWAFW
ncbi:MAG TPA: CAAX prenyl protease-related protein [Tepidisphaeraceae bacterium]|jgi:hypothetical protein